MDNEEIKQIAEQNAIPKMAIKQELGGGFYYKCPWIACNTDLKRYWNYCPNCGQRIIIREE